MIRRVQHISYVDKTEQIFSNESKNPIKILLYNPIFPYDDDENETKTK